MANFSLIFGIVLGLNVILTLRSSDWYKTWSKSGSSVVSLATIEEESTLNTDMKKKHFKLLRNYLVVYLLGTFSDWLQGPYVYALYSSYGYKQTQIAQLFVAGFGSSMIFGSFVGGMADWGGRRTFVILFSFIYAASCLTKHFNSYWVLMLGRLLGGIATSLLFSVFDAWLIRAHSDADLPKSFLSKSFAWAQYGNSIIAILAGLIAEHVADWYKMGKFGDDHTFIDGANDEENLKFDPNDQSFYIGGYVSPFDLALVSLVGCGIAARTLWYENYGDASNSETDNESPTSVMTGGKAEDDSSRGIAHNHWYDGLKNALTTTLRNRDIFLCGIISSFFEGSMYIFVFMWTPLLKALAREDIITAALASGEQLKKTEDGEYDITIDLPFGIIFATFMVCCMAGSSLFSILVAKYPIERIGILVFGVGSIAMAIVAMAPNETISFLGMNMFELCVGMYFPIMGTMKGGIVPEDKRAAIYNLYRIPLNLIVVLSLLIGLKPFFAFTINAIMLGTATFLQVILAKRRLENTGTLENLVSKLKNEMDEETVELLAQSEQK